MAEERRKDDESIGREPEDLVNRDDDELEDTEDLDDLDIDEDDERPKAS
jgi:hypothetical protein